MNRNQNTAPNPFGSNPNSPYFFRLVKTFSGAKMIMNFDVIPYSMNYHQKLPIIYANIRV
jgi:hypothetical protein